MADANNNTNPAPGSQEWAEKLVDAYGRAMFTWGDKSRLFGYGVGLQEKAHTEGPRQALIQALTVPNRTEEDDYVTVRDEAVFASIDTAKDTASEMSAETAAEIAGVPMREYKWRTHYPKVLAVLSHDIGEAVMAERSRRMRGGV